MFAKTNFHVSTRKSINFYEVGYLSVKIVYIFQFFSAVSDQNSYVHRIKNANYQVPAWQTSLQNQINSALQATDFVSFSNAVKSPHNSIHGLLGGGSASSNPGCSMGYVQSAAYDPIFWLNHAFVDKVWADRQNNANLGTMANSNLDDTFLLRPFVGMK